MRSSTGITLSLGLSLMMCGSALALGLGNVSGQAILGQPLLVEISLIGGDHETPSAECFRIRHPTAEIESAFVLRNAQIQLLGEHGRARLIVTTAAPVREPVIEFAVAVGCGFELSRDYLLLASEPAKTIAPALPIIPPTLATEESPHGQEQPPNIPKSDLAVAPSGQLLRIEKDVTLSALGQQNYPLQPKARQKYMRMMVQANPNLRHNEELINAGSELHIPLGLPLQRHGAYHSAPNAALAGQGATRPNVRSPQAPATIKPATRKPNQDLLVLGAPAQRNAAELLAEAERLTALLMEQTNAQNMTSEKITQLENTLDSLKKHVHGLESRINAIEVERQAEKLSATPAYLNFFALFLAVLAGGAIGGLMLHFYNRLRLRRNHGLTLATQISPIHPAPTPTPIEPKPKNDFDFVSKQST